MKWVTLVLVSAIALFQYQLWIGKGSYHDVVVTDGKIAAQQATNANLQLRNNALSAEVADLTTAARPSLKSPASIWATSNKAKPTTA